MYAGDTMGDDEVAILADAARAHRQLTKLRFDRQCSAVGMIACVYGGGAGGSG